MNYEPAVLYVEDDPQSRKLMQRLLQGRLKLPQVTIFEDSYDFMERAQMLDPRPDVIFLDIHVKPYDGFEMLSMLRQMEGVEEIPIIALTASVMNEEVQKLRTSGFNGCLAKPINMTTFPETFERIMNGETVWHILDY